MNPVKASTANQTLFSQRAERHFRQQSQRDGDGEEHDDDSQLPGQSGDHDQGQDRHNLDPRIEPLQQALFSSRVLRLRRCAAAHPQKTTRLRSTTPRDLALMVSLSSDRFLVRAKIQPISKKSPMMRPLPNMADITYPKAGRRTNGGAYCGKGALHTDESRSNPRGCRAGGATLPEAAAIFCRISGLEKSRTLHSPQAVPAARIPRGVRSMSSAKRIQSGRVSPQSRSRRRPGSHASSACLKNVSSSEGFVRCRYATTPPETNNSARPGESKMPDHHRRNRDVQRVGSVQRSSAGIFEKQRLNSQFACSKKRRSIDGGVTGQCAAIIRREEVSAVLPATNR